MGTNWEQITIFAFEPETHLNPMEEDKVKISAFIRKSTRKGSISKTPIYIRVRLKDKDMKAVTELTICPSHWSGERQGYKDRVALVPTEEQKELNRKIKELIELLAKEYNADSGNEWLQKTIDKFHHPEKYPVVVKEKKQTFSELFDEFLEKHNLSEVRKKNFRVVRRTLMRYELYVRKVRRQQDFELDVDAITEKTLGDIWTFMEQEHEIVKKYPAIYNTCPEKRLPQARGKNTLIDAFSRFRTFMLWCYAQEKTTNRPFDKFPIEECLYGTPIYITLEERNQLYKADLSDYPQIALQRDIFVFQSVVGCRVGDLYKFTKSNIVNGALEYIQQKTHSHNPRTIRVPLNNIAKEILARYEDGEREAILPFISEQKYNRHIKEAFKLAGLDRVVTTLNPLTRELEKKKLYEVVSTHTARKTFIGNMYEKVKDPDLVSALSGHKEGSKAFRRYRDIDEDMRKDLVKLLDYDTSDSPQEKSSEG